MFKILGKNGLRTSAFALACFALAGSTVKGDSMTPTVLTDPVTSAPVSAAGPQEMYTTTGSIASTGVVGTPDVTFAPPTGTPSFGLSGGVSLGSFTVSANTDGSPTTYNNTPFTITYIPTQISGGSTDLFPNTAILITGVLNGTNTPTTSGVTATFNSVTSPVFSTPDGNYVSTISLPADGYTLVSPGTNGGVTTIQAIVTTTATNQPPLGSSNTTPEPTTLAILGTAIVGLGLRQRLRKGRQVA